MGRIKVAVYARDPLHRAYLCSAMATLPEVEVVALQHADHETALIVEKGILTPAETRVLEAFCWCDSVKEVADGLAMSEATVKKHLEHIYGKLGVRRLHRALIKALRLGLIGGSSPSSDV